MFDIIFVYVIRQSTIAHNFGITNCYFRIKGKCFTHILSYVAYYNHYLAIVSSFETIFMPKLVGHITLGLSVCPHHFFLNF